MFLFSRLTRLHHAQIVREKVPDIEVNGSLTHRYPGNLNISFTFVEGESLIMSVRDVAVSSGKTIYTDLFVCLLLSCAHRGTGGSALHISGESVYTVGRW